MAKAKKSLSLLLLLSILISTICTSTAFAATDTFQSDTNANFTLRLGKTYTLKVTASNSQMSLAISTGDSKTLPIISANKKAQDYFATIKAIGKVGSSAGIYATVKGQAAVKLFTVTIGNATRKDDLHEYDNYIPPDDNYLSVINNTIEDQQKHPYVKGLYGIIETRGEDASEYTRAGVLLPLITRFDSSRTFDEQANALRSNLCGGCDLVGTTIGKGAEVSYGRGIAHFLQQDGKYGLRVNIGDWRHNKNENVGNDSLNSVLNAFCFLANDKMAGEALWTLYDDFCCNEMQDSKDYGFTDSNPNSNYGTFTYKDGTQIDYSYENGRMTFFFSQKQ